MRTRLHAFCALLIVAAPTACAPVPALAEGAGTVVDLSPLVGTGIELLGAVLLGLGAWAVKRLVAWLGLRQDAEVRAYLDAAMERALGYGLALAKERGGDLAHIDVRSELVADAAGYVVRRVPDALKRFGIAPDDVRDLIRARLSDSLPG